NKSPAATVRAAVARGDGATRSHLVATWVLAPAAPGLAGRLWGRRDGGNGFHGLPQSRRHHRRTRGLVGPVGVLPPYPYYPPEVVVGGVARTADRLRLPPS